MRRPLFVCLTVFALLVASCGDDDGGEVAAEETTTSTIAAPESSTTADTTPTTSAPEPVAPLQILVTNDDGIGAPGIDEVVRQLAAVDGLDVTIVAPAENQSGSSDMTTNGGAPSAPGATASGVEGTAVSGFPADSVNVALDELGLQPDLVVSGINEGQNVGPFAMLSGTIGAARTAIRRGIPAVAGSAGLGDNADFEAAAELVVAWIEDNRDAIADGSIGADEVVSYNVPGCTAGEIRPVVAVPLAAALPDGANVFETDCSVEPAGPPADDVAAMIAGFASETRVPADL